MVLFDILTVHQINNAHENGATLFKRARSLIIRQGEPANGIYIICSGTVESVCHTHTDRELRLARWEINDFVGAPHVFGGEKQKWSARALCDSEILHLDQSCLYKLIENDADFAVKLIQAIGYKGQCYSELAQRLAFNTVTERLALKLLDLSPIQTQSTPTNTSINLPSLLQLSKEIGATRQSVGSAVRTFKAKGLLRLERNNRYTVRVEALRELAGMNEYNL